MTLQNKIFIFFLIIAGLSIMSYAAVQLDAESLKQFHAERSITASNGKRLYQILYFAKKYTAGENQSNLQKLKSQMYRSAQRFNDELQKLKNGGNYKFGNETITLDPLSLKYQKEVNNLSVLWARFYGEVTVVNTEKLMVNSEDDINNFGIKVPNKKVTDALNDIDKLYPEIDKLNDDLLVLFTEGLNQEQDNFRLTLLFLGVLNLIVLIVGYVIIVRNTIQPLKQIADVATLVASGNFVKSSNRPSNDEIGALTNSISLLVDSLEEVSEFAHNIGQGNFDLEFKVRNNQDKLGNALLEMRDSLKLIAEEDKKRNWANEGMAQFGEILRTNNEDIDELSYNIISNMVKYLKANQGGIFLINGEHHTRYLELTAAYAYNKKKYLQKRVEIGQGLLGQCVLEEDTIHLREIPNGYIDITSGLGEATPNSLLIVPLKVNDKVYGVIEIASFNIFQPFEIQFLERLSENVASTLANVRSTQRTKALLEESQLYAEQLRAQEEEMRQNMEELAATQEEMSRVQIEMKNNEYNLNALINNTEDMIWAIDNEYKLLVFNQAFYEYNERKGLHLKKGILIFDTLSEDVTQFWKKNYDRGLSGEQFMLVENFKTFTYEDEYQAISFNPIISPTDEVEGLSVFIKDVTSLNPIRWED